MYCSYVVWKTNHRICFQLASTVPEDVYLDVLLSYQYRLFFYRVILMWCLQHCPSESHLN